MESMDIDTFLDYLEQVEFDLRRSGMIASSADYKECIRRLQEYADACYDVVRKLEVMI